MSRSYFPGPEYSQTTGFAFARPDGTIHDGIDYPAPEGTDIRASADGKVIYSGKNGESVADGGNQDSGYGNTVIIEHSDRLGNKVYSLYAHMKDGTPIKHGANVKAGDKIGGVGNTGNHEGKNGGYHLHHEVIKPAGTDAKGPYVEDKGTKYYPNNSDKGGAIGIPSNVGRINPETYNNYNGEAFGKGHAKYQPLVDEMSAKALADIRRRNHSNPDSPKKPSGGGFPGTHANSGAGSGGSDGGTLERRGEQVFRIEPNGSERGSFHSR